jgi:hypothetical protein
MVLLSVTAGLRAKEIATVQWGMVTDAEGEVGERTVQARTSVVSALCPSIRSCELP